MSGTLRRWIPALIALAACADDGVLDRPPVVVFAAASAADVVEAIGAQFERDTGTPVRVNAAASSVLARQIEAGAEFDVFIPAHVEWMDFADALGAVDAATRIDAVTNQLVLVAPKHSQTKAHQDPRSLLSDPSRFAGRIAMGDPAHVPAGIYAEQALRSLGAWDGLQANTVFAMDARAAVRFVELGEVEAGIVYATDATASSEVAVLGPLAKTLHSPIVYPFAVARNAAPDGVSFFSRLCSDSGLALFRAAGFQVLPTAAPTSVR